MNGSQDFELIVHIGSGKTGSTSIQATLAANSKSLLKQKIKYLGLMGEEFPDVDYQWQRPDGWPIFLANRAKEADNLAILFKTGIEKLKASGFQKAIWSNEAIFENADTMIPILQAIGKTGIKIKLIVYLRRHDAWARSAYLQWGIKHKTYAGPIRPFKKWWRLRQLSYSKKLEPWQKEIWENIAIRNFDACKDVVVDILGLCNIEQGSIQVKRANESPDALSLVLWALFNNQSPTPILPNELMPILQQSGLLQQSIQDLDWLKLLPSQKDLQAIQEEAKDDRDKINKIFRNSDQPEMETTSLKEKDMTVTQSQINAALLLMIKQQHNKIANLERRLNIFLEEKK